MYKAHILYESNSRELTTVKILHLGEYKTPEKQSLILQVYILSIYMYVLVATDDLSNRSFITNLC